MSSPVRSALVRTFGSAGALWLAIAAPHAFAQAPDLIIARGNEHVSMDPQFARTGNNQATAQSIFERLIETDENLRPIPGLALSWRNVDPMTWEVKLRANVKFHDGSPLTAEDVVYSLQRPPTIPNSPASFAPSVGNIAHLDIVDPLTIKITSKTPDPRLIEEAGRVYIVSKKAAEGATNEQFNKGPAAIGTGPYKFVSWTPAASMTLERNDDYWGEKPQFRRVLVRFITNAAARIAALKAGDVHLVDLVPPNFVEELRKDKNLVVTEAETLTLVYLALDSTRDKAPLLTDATGKPLDTNPLKDVRVRRALSMMIDRTRMVSAVLGGAGTPAGQIVPPGVFGHQPSATPPAFDAARAKSLLEEAGWPKGFGVSLFGSNDRFPQDGNVLQAIAQMWARGGIKVNEVKPLPYAVFAKNATQGDYSIFQFSYGSTTGEASAGLNGVLHTVDQAKGYGGNNRTRYSNAAFDAVLDKALVEFDPAKREEMLKEATRIVFEDVGIIPLYWQKLAWASRKGFAFTPDRDGRTIASNVKKQ